MKRSIVFIKTKALSVVLASTFLALPASADPKGTVPLAHLTSCSLEELAVTAQQVLMRGHFGSCARVNAYELIPPSISSSEGEDLLWDDGIETVHVRAHDLTTADSTRLAVIAAVMDVIQDGERDPEGAESLFHSLRSALSNGTGLRLYSGFAAGAFETSLGSMVIVDSLNSEALVIQEGYCE